MNFLIKLSLLLFSALSQLPSFSQKDLVFPVNETGNFNWKRIEKKPVKAVMDKFIQDHKKEFEPYLMNEPETYANNIDSLRKVLHFTDLNKDGKDDIIFEGESGSEAKMVKIFIAVGNGFKKVFSGFQCIDKLEWKDGRLSRLYITNGGCCGEYQLFHFIYNVGYSNTGMPVFEKIFQGLSFYNGEMPDSIMAEWAFRVQVMNDGYKIRTAPKLDDTSFQLWDEDESKPGSGNSIARLPKGATALAIAKKTDGTGREWLFIQLDEAYLPKNNIIYVADESPVKLMGWVSGRFVKMLE